MKSLVCPVSPLRVDRNVVRLTGFLMAVMMGLFTLTGNPLVLVAVTLDYGVRAFVPWPNSAFGWLAERLAAALRLPRQSQDKAPKIFSARVGFLFALVATVLAPFSLPASLAVALTLMVFALLESLADLCVGCLVYTHVVWPRLGER